MLKSAFLFSLDNLRLFYFTSLNEKLITSFGFYFIIDDSYFPGQNDQTVKVLWQQATKIHQLTGSLVMPTWSLEDSDSEYYFII